jgi:uncharacterized protein (TIGR02145 family)
MNKVKLALSACLVLATTFTFSCSSGDEGGNNNTSSSSVGGQGDGSVTLQGQTYKTVRIGDQVWFAENLNYNASGSKCYGEDGQVVVDWEDDIPITITLSPDKVRANCTKYGRLYDWATAMALTSNCNSNSCIDQINSPHRGICPNGWHIPSNADWDKLMEFVGGEAGTRLKARNGWDGSGDGTDDYGFSALPGGYYSDKSDNDNDDYDGNSDGNGNDTDDYGNSDCGFREVGRLGVWWSTREGYGIGVWVIGYDNKTPRWEKFGKSGLSSVRCLKD